MSLAHFRWSSTGSADRPRIFVLRLSNSCLMRAMAPSSVVHTGVKSLGCENRTAQPLPIQSWKLIVPSVVSAVKFGASSPKRNGIVASVGLDSRNKKPRERRGLLQGCRGLLRDAGGRRRLLGKDQNDLLVGADLDGHLAAVREASEQQLIGERRANQVLDQPRHRARAHLR